MASNSLKMRDAVATMITGLIDRQRPKPRVCEVYSYNRFTRFAEVLLPGETEPGIQARFPAHLQPTACKMDDGVGNATGNLVLVEGTTNNYRVTQIVEGDAFGQTAVIRPNDTLGGGGTITWDDRYLKWSADFISVVGVNQLLTGGMFVIPMPAVSTVVKCHGINGDADSAVASGGVDMQPDGTSNYSILYYAPDLGGGSGSNGVFHLVGTITALNIPPTWMMVALMDQPSNCLTLANDRTLRPGQAIINGELSEPYWYGFLNASPTAVAASTPTTFTGWVADGSPNSYGITHSSGIFTVPVDGEYRARLHCWWGGSAGQTGGRLSQVLKVSPNLLYDSHTALSSQIGTIPAINLVDKVIKLTAGEQLYFRWQHTDTVNRAPTGSSADITWMQIKRVGP